MGEGDKICFVIARIGPDGFQHRLLSIPIAMGCFYLILADVERRKDGSWRRYKPRGG